MIVLIAIMEKTVVITDSFNPNPIQGRQSIFNRVSAQTEQRLDVEIVGVYSNLEMAGEARKHHAAGHPGRRYLQKVAQLDDNAKYEPPEPPKCIKCGVPTQGGQSFCIRCQTEHLRQCKEGDPLGGQGDNVPVRQTNFGGQSTLMVGQPS